MIGQFAEDDAKVLEDIKKINEQNDALKEEFSKLRLNIEVKVIYFHRLASMSSVDITFSDLIALALFCLTNVGGSAKFCLVQVNI